MPDDNVGSADAHEKAYGISSDDVDFLIDTLRVYTAQLRAQLQQSQAQSLSIGVYTAVVGLLASISSALFALYNVNERLNSYRLNEEAVFSISLGLIVAAAGGLWVGVQSYRRVQASRRETDRIAHTLLGLIRRSSQLIDRSDLIYAKRVLMDLILLDAEQVISTAQSRKFFRFAF